MADYKHFRIIVDLSAYFYDHRRVARVFIKKNLKCIADLQNRISEIFEISDFYLTTDGQFLPASEDIRVLNNNESVCIIPCKPQEVARPVTSSSEKECTNHKRHLETIPEHTDETPTGKNKKSKKKHLNVTPLSSGSNEDEIPRKRKKSENNESLVLGEGGRTKKKQKKVRENGENPPRESSCENEASYDMKQNQSIVERQICNIESSQKIIDIKKKLKQKADEYLKKHLKEAPCNFVDTSSNLKNVLPKLQSHIKNCNDVGRSNLPDTIRLSRRVDTPIKTFTSYIPPPRITDTYLAKNKVNIVKIDVVKKQSEEVDEQLNVSQSSTNSVISVGTYNENVAGSTFHHISDESDTSPKNYVKEVIDSYEKIISPEPNKQVEKQDNNGSKKRVEKQVNEASNYTKEFLDQREPNISDSFETKTDVAVNLTKNSIDDAPAVNTIVNGLEKNQASCSETQTLKIEKHPAARLLSEGMESSKLSLDFSSIDTLLDTSHYLSSSLNSTNTSLDINNSSLNAKNVTAMKRFGVVGPLLDRLRESDSVISVETDSSSQFVTKRKRIRKHKRKTKKNDSEEKPTSVKEVTYVAKPMNVNAYPNLHIKFDDNEDQMDTLEEKPLLITYEKKESDTDNKVAIKTENENKLEVSDINENRSRLVEAVVLSDEDDDPIMENKSIFGEESISKAPLMTNKLEPKIGDVIAFKIITMGKDYTPQVSSYIVGKLEIYSLDSRTVHFKILRGEEQLVPPSGKLSLKEDIDVQPLRYRTFSWTELIEPKLLYP